MNLDDSNCLINNNDSFRRTVPKQAKQRDCTSSTEATASGPQTKVVPMVVFQCIRCRFNSCYPESIRKHYRKEHQCEPPSEEKIMHETYVANTLSVSKNALEFHDVTYICIECHFINYDIQRIRNHVMEEHFVSDDLDSLISTDFNCPDCYRSFNSKKALNIHHTVTHVRRGRSSTEIYLCDHCLKEFTQKSGLLFHKRVCSPSKAVDCCHKSICLSSQLDSHWVAEHQVNIANECDICNNIYQTPYSLAVHRKRHSERHYQCDVCQRNYINVTELRMHMEREHSSGEQVECSVCGEIFGGKRSLIEHQRTHQFRLFTCRYCDFKAHARYEVRKHQREHTGKPYKCQLCPKEYVSRDGIVKHSLNIHDICLTQQELAAMFQRSMGYKCRSDIFSVEDKNFDINEVSGEDVEQELEQLGVNFGEIIKELLTTEPQSIEEIIYCDNE